VVFSSTAELITPRTTRLPATPRSSVTRERRASSGARFYLILGAVAIGIAALSLLIPSTPSYDPWAWLVWGREIAHLKLHTTAGPSWKPLPVVFTTAFSPFGSAAPDLWLVVARAGAVMATVLCFKLAWRLTQRLSGGAPVRAIAGVIAAGTFVNSQGVLSGNALGYSEGLMVALVLIALERQLDGAPRQAFVVGFFACLDRPELWLLWIPYGLYLWRVEPRARRLIASLFVLIPILWFLPELWGSGHLLRGIARAQNPRSNSPAYAHCPFCAEFTKHAWPSAFPRVEVAALAAMAAAALGLLRKRSARGGALLLGIGAAGFAWWLGVAVETQLGFSGNDRYLELGTALVGITGGAAWAWAAIAVARAVPGRLRERGWATPGCLTVAVGAFLAVPPWIGTKGVISLPATHGALAYQARLRQDLTKAVSELGGPSKILRCGSVMTEGFQVPMVAWTLGVHTVHIEASPTSVEAPGPAPNVVFQARATRTAFLLPVIQSWRSVRYTLVAHERTFSVYSSCRARVRL
jgi:hypothetical protein